MTKVKGPYTVWVDYGYEGWKPYDYPTLEQALSHEAYGHDKHVSRPVKYEVIEEPTSDQIDLEEAIGKAMMP